MIRLLIIGFTLIFSTANLWSQRYKGNADFTGYMDSLDLRISALQQEIEVLKKQRKPALYHTMKDLDYTKFRKEYTQYIIDEELDLCHDIIYKKLDEANLRKDKDAIAFYDSYKDEINLEIKRQKMYYQALFKDEKTFKKEYSKIIKPGNDEAFNDGLKFLGYAIKFAGENEMTGTLEYLNRYKTELEFEIFDFHIEFDLQKLTDKESDFLDVFSPLVNSDSLNDILKGQQLVESAFTYSATMKPKVDTVFLNRQKIRALNAITDYYSKADIKQQFSGFSDQALEVRRDTLNRKGVYKWNEFIVVINNFKPSSSFDNVRRGEAFLNSDKFLSKYIEANELGVLSNGANMGKTYFISFLYEGSEQTFYYDEQNEDYQYIVVYTMVDNPEFTEQVRKYLPPMTIKEIN